MDRPTNCYPSHRQSPAFPFFAPFFLPIKKKNKKIDPFWQYTSLIFEQFEGVKAGYAQASLDFEGVEPLDDWAFEIMNTAMEFLDIAAKLNVTLRIPWFSSDNSLTEKDLFRLKNMRGHCSGLVKISPEIDDMAQTAFFSNGEGGNENLPFLSCANG